MEENLHEFKVKTSIGLFRVKRYNTINYDKTYSKDFMKLGGKNFCIELKWDRNIPTIAELQWIITENGGCELTGIEIKKDKTVHMFHLAITLLLKYLPTLEKVELLDNSKFKCTMPNGKSIQISTNYFHFLIHGSTYYDLKYEAFPIHSNDNISYNKIKQNLIDPLKKPEMFDFGNRDLNEELQPLFKESLSWKDFFEKIKNIRELCQKMAGWYRNAFSILSDKGVLPEYWYITKFINISFTEVQYGGKRIKNKKTRKNKFVEYDYLSPSDFEKIKFRY